MKRTKRSFEFQQLCGITMRLLELAEQNRKEANKLLNPKTKSALGQFMTPAPIYLFMASLFDNIESDVKLLVLGS